MALFGNHAPHCRPFSTAVNPQFRPSLGLKQHSLFRLQTNSGDVYPREETPMFDGETSSRILAVEDVPPLKKNTFYNSFQEEDEQMQPQFGELLDKLNLKLDIEDSYSLLLYGGGTLVSVWLLSAVVGAIDSIPLFTELMEVVGLSYSVWFTARYLIFKENREELVAKIEELKQQVLGSDKE